MKSNAPISKITIRDDIAIRLLIGMFADPNFNPPLSQIQELAKNCYLIADAMIADAMIAESEKKQ